MDEIEQLGRELDRISTTTNFNGKYILSGRYADTGITSEDERYAENIVYEDINGDAEITGSLNLQVGANTLFGDVISINFSGVNASNLLNNDDNTFWEHDGGYSTMGKLVREDLDALSNAEGIVGDEEESVNTLTGNNNEWTIHGFQSLVNIIDGKNTDGTTRDIDQAKTGIALVNELRSTLGAVQNRLEHTVSNVDTVAENIQSAESRIRDVDMAKEMMSFTKNNILNQAATAMLAQANQAPQTVLQLLQ